MASAMGKTSIAVFMVSRGTWAARRVAASMALRRASFSSGVPFGRPMAAIIPSKDRVSSSTSSSIFASTFWPLSAHCENSSQRSSQPRFPAERLATIVLSAAPKAPITAATLPPPGAGDSDAVSSAKPFTVILTSLSLAASSAGSAIRYSMTFSRGSKGLRSSRPMLLIAILRSSLSDTPTLRCCFSRK